MNGKFWLGVAQSLTVAGIVGLFAVLWQFDRRLSRLETILQTKNRITKNELANSVQR